MHATRPSRARSIGVLDTVQNAVYLDLAPGNAAGLVSLGNGIAGALAGSAGGRNSAKGGRLGCGFCEPGK